MAAPVHELLTQGADALVLGCTHFPFLHDAIQAAAGPAVPLLETGGPVARRLRHQLQERGLLAGAGASAVELVTTGDAAALAGLAAQLLGLPATATRVPPGWC